MIFLFTGTGNSRFVAENIAKNTGDTIFNIAESLKYGTEPELTEGDKVIVVAPTYAWRLPKIIERWLKFRKLKGASGIYFVMTCGGEISNAGAYNKGIAKMMGIKYMGTFGIKFPDNYIVMFKEETKEHADQTLEEAIPKISEVISYIKEGKEFPEPKVTLFDRFKSSVVNNSFYKGVNAAGFVAKPNCTGCALCEVNCPLDNIKMVAGEPSWGKKCTHCMACISYCPEEAIEFSTKTQGKRRYTFESFFPDMKK